jgi:hypothetical protein
MEGTIVMLQVDDLEEKRRSLAILRSIRRSIYPVPDEPTGRLLFTVHHKFIRTRSILKAFNYKTKM